MSDITIRHDSRDGEPMTILESDALGSRNTVYVSPDKVEICLSDWYGRHSPDEAVAGIDDIIALLTAAKAEITKMKEQSNDLS